MARKGRKGKAKRREPSGKLQRTPSIERAEAVVAVVRRQPHRVKLADPGDTRASDVLGQLNLAGEITNAQFQAGTEWQKARAAMLRAKGLPNPNPKSGGFDYVPERIDHNSAPQASDTRSEEKKIEDALIKYDRMLSALADAGLHEKMETWRVCDENLVPRFMDRLHAGLDALVKHLGIPVRLGAERDAA